MTKRFGLLLALIPGVLAACSADSSTESGGSEDELRGLSGAEVTADLNVMADTIRAYYGPLQYKKERFGFDLDKEVTKAKAAITKSKTEAERVRALYTLLAGLQDGHVSLEWQLPGDKSSSFALPFIVQPVEDGYLVVATAPNVGIKRGDELVSIDGKSVKAMEDAIRATDNIGTPESTRHDLGFRMTQRQFFDKLLPTGKTASVVLKHADGTQSTVSLDWEESKGGIAGQIVTPPPAPVSPAPATQPSSVAPGATAAASDPLAATHGAYSGHTAYMLQKIQDLDTQQGSILQQGVLAPWFLTGPVKTSKGVVEVTPTPESLKKFGVSIPDPAEDPKAAQFINLKAWKYKHEGKVVLLVRIPVYETPHDNNFDDQISWLAGLLQENMAGGTGDVAVAPPAPAAGAAPAPAVDTSFVSQPADVLVIDDTHNPGGAVPYALGLASLLITKPIPNLVQRQHADKRWISRYVGQANYFLSIPGAPPELGNAFVERSKTIESAFDASQWLSDFVPVSGRSTGNTAGLELEDLTGANMLNPHPEVNWNKPLLVLHDELSGSCGDFFPGLLQNAGIKTFGARTMGLGGSVEQVAVLPNSGAILSLTRGMGGAWNADPSKVKFIENDGITPSIPGTITKADFRAGFGGYVKAFSDAAIGLAK